MNHLSSVGFGLERGLAAAAMSLCAAAVTGAAAAQTPAVHPTASPVSGGPGSLNGLWFSANFSDVRTGAPAGGGPVLKTADGAPVPMLPWAAKVAKERQIGFEDGKPWAENSVKCITNGMPWGIGTAMEQPLEFVETPKQQQITVLYETFNTFRIINMNQKHPAHPTPSLWGDAVGHWEGDTLVIDTIAVSDKTTIETVIPHTDQLHLVERVRLISPTMMEDQLTLDDPNTFSKSWTMVKRLKRVPGSSISEFVCDNNRNGADENGDTATKVSVTN